MCISNSQTTKPARIVWGLGESDRTESESLCVYREREPGGNYRSRPDRAPAANDRPRQRWRTAIGERLRRYPYGRRGVAGARQCTD